MDKLKLFRYPLLIIAVLIIGTGLYFLGSKYALDHLSIRQITPTQAANAMKDDHFWSSYREDILLITGEVISVAQSGNNTVVGFKTNSSFGTECSFANFSDTVSRGQTIKIISIANSAERETSAVKLNHCLLQ